MTQGTRLTQDLADGLRQAAQTLVDTQAASSALRAGGHAPPVRLPDTSGAMVSVERRFAQQPVLLLFSRGPWCPVTGVELQALHRLQPALVQAGAGSAAITPQSVEDNRLTAQSLGLDILLLSDAKGQAARAFGLSFQIPATVTALARAELGAALPPADRTGCSWLPMSARYVIGADGVIAYSELDPTPAQASPLTDLLSVLCKLGRRRTGPGSASPGYPRPGPRAYTGIGQRQDET